MAPCQLPHYVSTCTSWALVCQHKNFLDKFPLYSYFVDYDNITSSCRRCTAQGSLPPIALSGASYVEAHDV
eukprot:c4573_g1_i1 orf=3-212(-)